ncbi:MAG: hypothetical protein WC979_02980 [Candidatus Pacearchaeota archaeon]|jgi:hypothetical protein|nr:hypothetical protein [Clostridia bacterium]
MKEVKSLKEQYIQMFADKITVSVDDLTESEKALINFAYELFLEKLEEIKIANDELKRTKIELLNLKIMLDD